MELKKQELTPELEDLTADIFRALDCYDDLPPDQTLAILAQIAGYVMSYISRATPEMTYKDLARLVAKNIRVGFEQGSTIDIHDDKELN